MGGKGRRRREKNYRAAHGGHTRLPPPPDHSKVDALPSKLRKLMSLASTNLPKSTKEEEEEKKKPKTNTSDKDWPPKDHKRLPVASLEGDEDGEKKKRKRKRKQVEDLRFETIGEKTGQRKRERKKKYLDAKKMKKQKKLEEKEKLDFPGRDQVKFGDVVQAPPKQLAVPKPLKNFQDASHERLRLQAIEAYRNRKGWISRPGLKIPSPVTTTPLL